MRPPPFTSPSPRESWEQCEMQSFSSDTFPEQPTSGEAGEQTRPFDGMPKCGSEISSSSTAWL